MEKEFIDLLFELEEQGNKLESGILTISAINSDMCEDSIALKTAAEALVCPVDYLWIVMGTIKQLVSAAFEKAGYAA